MPLETGRIERRYEDPHSIIDQLPIIVRTYEKQNTLIDQMDGYIKGAVSLAGDVPADRSYEAGRADAFREMGRFWRDKVRGLAAK